MGGGAALPRPGASPSIKYSWHSSILAFAEERLRLMPKAFSFVTERIKDMVDNSESF